MRNRDVPFGDEPETLSCTGWQLTHESSQRYELNSMHELLQHVFYKALSDSFQMNAMIKAQDALRNTAAGFLFPWAGSVAVIRLFSSAAGLAIF